MCVAPPIYNIPATDEIKSRDRFSKIDDWGWMNLREMTACAIEANSLACTVLGNPKVPIPWITAKSDAGLVNDFGCLMWGNEAQKDIRYTYVRFCGRHAPATHDFSLEGFKLPTDFECQAGNIYVPSGWATKVLGYIRQGYFKIELSGHLNRKQFSCIDGSVGYIM